MDYYVGEIRLLPYTFNPMDWLPCDGSAQSIATYQALYAVIGTTYGGDGRNTFNLPDLRGCIPVGANSQNPSLVQLTPGHKTGSSTVALTAFPLHNHGMNGQNTNVTANRLTMPANNAQPSQVMYNGTTPQKAFSSVSIPDTVFAPQAIGPAGGAPTAAHPNQQPYLPLNFMIAVNGVFPSPA